MGDHLVLVVDRLSSNSGVGMVNRIELEADSVNKDGLSESITGNDLCESKFVQCRICHDEDEDTNMDSPCSCSGTLKFAHRNCVQRWCNEKGDTICEICRQQYKAGYTAPRQLFHYTGISMNFRDDWGIEGLDLRNPYFLTWDAVDDHELYSFHSPTSLICCRVIAFLFILLLFLRHSLPIFLGGNNDFSLTLLMLPLVRTLAILFVAYLFVKAFTAIQRCRQERDTRLSGFSSDEETTPQPRISMALPEGPELHLPVN
ncbi:putative E3 ubiquitin ligase SUD1 [Cardamine amara subsp. amara]|uniref:E3 ubiquitin ligase SUD1 n=1 Tax=Cardamine amara subsp. amara TaxID=228776 RepID=A0ABD1AJV1_CARAN